MLALRCHVWRQATWLALAATLAALGTSAACSGGSGAGAAPLRLVFHSDPQGLDPHLHDEVATHWVLDNVYDALVTFDADMHVRPTLAVAWDNPDDLTWRFQLRPGVRFQDGRPLAAADVVVSLERARSHPQSKMSGYLVEVAAVRAVDPHTVEVQTRRPYPILLNKLTFIAIVPRDAPPRIVKPLGTGPYRFVSYAPGRGLELAVFDGGWRAAEELEPRVSIGFESVAAKRVERLTSGRADLIAEMPSQYADRVKSAPGCAVRSAGGLAVNYLQPRVDAPPFSDPRVRRAISLAVDREELVRAMLHGRGAPAGQMVGPKVFGYAPELQPPRRDLAAARQLLAAAGFPGGLDAVLEYRDGQEVAALRAQLAEAGIRLRLRPRPWSELYPRLLRGQVAFYYGSWQCSSGDASDLFDNKVHTRDKARGYGDSNSNGYGNPALDKLIESSGATLNMNERRRILESAMRLLDADLPLIPLAIPFNLFGVRTTLAWAPRLDARIQVAGMRRVDR
ncbi:MAG TPA: ABC transporter substrate-binding protein [Thermoanaerobaculia bacterium]|nr:ABC transporter substrate-binding protein [Thermoanaerobaculia bacterium]